MSESRNNCTPERNVEVTGMAIANTIGNLDRYVSDHPRFAQAFDFIRAAFNKLMPAGEHVIDGSNLKANVVRAGLHPPTEAKLEGHQRYIDIHVVLKGTELIGWSPLEACTPEGPYDDEKDLVFFEEQPQNWIKLPARSFAIFYPQGAHAPMNGDGSIEKMIVKVLI
jgi:YhcH/YjgK/YiaL family protein